MCEHFVGGRCYRFWIAFYIKGGWDCVCMNGKSEHNNDTKNNNLFIREKKVDSMKTFPLLDESMRFIFVSSSFCLFCCLWVCNFDLLFDSIVKVGESECIQASAKIKLSIESENVPARRTTTIIQYKEVCNKQHSNRYIDKRWDTFKIFFSTFFSTNFEYFYYCLPYLNCLANWIRT